MYKYVHVQYIDTSAYWRTHEQIYMFVYIYTYMHTQTPTHTEIWKQSFRLTNKIQDPRTSFINFRAQDSRTRSMFIHILSSGPTNMIIYSPLHLHTKKFESRARDPRTRFFIRGNCVRGFSGQTWKSWDSVHIDKSSYTFDSGPTNMILSPEQYFPPPQMVMAQGVMSHI